MTAARICPVGFGRDDGRTADWGHAAALAATTVPADGAEHVVWTVRGWAETALGCAATGTAEPFEGLDDAVRKSGIPCAGPFAGRLRALRGLGGAVPPWYRPTTAALMVRKPLPDLVVESCFAVAEYCDAVGLVLASHAGAPSSKVPDIPSSTTITDQLRWSEPYRAADSRRDYPVLDVDVPGELVWRAWTRLPAPQPGIVLIHPAARPTATLRQRVSQGVHNGAHLDHLAASAAQDPSPHGHPSPLEFGAGLLTAEAFAMSVEILALAECLAHGELAVARELRLALVSRMGRIPGFREWRASHPGGPRALSLAERDRVREFATLPTLAGIYVAGPLRLIGGGWADPLIPAALAGRIRFAWDQVCARFKPAAELTARATSLVG